MRDKMERNFRKSGTLKPCKLDRTELIKLVDIIKTGFNGTDINLRIYADWADVYISGNDIEQLLNHEELPDRLTSLSIYAEGTGDKRGSNIRLAFYSFSISLEIDSPDQLWLLGIYTQIKEFLETKKTWYWWFIKAFPFTYGVVPMLAGVMITVFIKDGEILYSLSTGIFMVTWILACYFQYKGRFLPYTQIIVRKSDNFLNNENINILIAFLSLIVSIIGIVVSLFAK